MKTFDEKFYICKTCQNNLYQNEIPCQAVCNKTDLDPMPDELKDLKKLEKVFILKRTLFKEIAKMSNKDDFLKIKGSICNVPIEAANICNLLTRSAVSNKLIVGKLKRDPKCRDHLYSKPTCPRISYQTLTYLRSDNKFHEDNSIAMCLLSEKMFRFFDIFEIQGENDSATEEAVSDRKEMSEGINTEIETGYALVEDTLNMNRTVSNEATFESVILNVVNEENVVIAQGQRKKASFNFR